MLEGLCMPGCIAGRRWLVWSLAGLVMAVALSISVLPGSALAAPLDS